MANILLVTGDTSHSAYTRTKAALEGQGHTVTGSLDTTAGLEAAWAGGSFDLIATVRVREGLVADWAWIRDKWTAGVPLLVGGAQIGGGTSGPFLADHLGITVNSERDTGFTSASRTVTALGTHPITAGYTTSVAVYGVDTLAMWDVGRTPHGTYVGGYSTGDTYMLALVKGDAITGSAALAPGATAPAPAVFCGWLYAGHGDYTADGKTIIGQSVAWLLSTPSVDVTLAGTATPATGAFNASHTAAPIEVALAGTAQAATAALTLDSQPPPPEANEVTLAGTAASAAAAFTLSQPVELTLVGTAAAAVGEFTVTMDTGAALVTLAGTARTATASLTLDNSYVVVESSDTFSNDGYNYTGTSRVFYEAPIAEPPPAIVREKVKRVHQSLPAPTVVNGGPTW